jgi:hypothetical protein
MNPGKRRLRKKIAAGVAKHYDDLAAITKSLVRISFPEPARRSSQTLERPFHKRT